MKFGLFGIFVSVNVVTNCLGQALVNDDTYVEELTIKRLATNQILSQFRFVITSVLKLGPDYALFPRIIAEVSKKHDIEEFHFSLAQGFWNNAKWGLPPQPAVPSGAELFAWFLGNATTVDDRWNHFVNSLNGIFCASLLEMIPTLTTSPQHSVNLRKVSNLSEQSFLRYAILPDETICTENLTPWKKLLPCKETGLSILLNPEKLYNSIYHSMSIHLTRVCQDAETFCKNRSRLELNLNVVTDLDLQSRSLDWSLYSIFGRKIEDNCKVAQSAHVLFEKDYSSVSIESPTEKKKHNGKGYYVYDVKNVPSESFPLNFHGRYRNKIDFTQEMAESTLRVHSFLGGTDQQSGRIITSIENAQSVPQEVTYFHVIPWFVKIYFHTINLRCSPLDRHEGSEVIGSTKLISFASAKNRKRPFLLEYELYLPAKSVCDFFFDFDKAFLRVTDFPPDANHGMYVPAAVISFRADQTLWEKNRTMLGDNRFTCEEELSGAKVPQTLSLFGKILLVSLPVPDFSMPFNVICFVSTAIAMLFGPVHSLTTKILIPVSEKDKDLVPKPLLTALFVKLKELLKCLIKRVKKFGKKQTTEFVKTDLSSTGNAAEQPLDLSSST